MKPAITVTHFIVENPWVSIALKVPQLMAEKMAANNEFIQSRYGFDVCSFLSSPFCALVNADYEGTPVNPKSREFDEVYRRSVVQDSMQGRKTFEVRIQVERHQWELIVRVAAAIGLPEAAVIRAGLWVRMRQLDELHARQSA